MTKCWGLILLAIIFCVAGVKGYFIDKKDDCFCYFPFALVMIWGCLV